MEEDSEGRRAIERRYGRVNVLRLVKQHEEDSENDKWFRASTTPCPGKSSCPHVMESVSYARPQDAKFEFKNLTDATMYVRIDAMPRTLRS